LKEIRHALGPENLEAALDRLLLLGGFPEPYLKGSQRYYKRWKRSHLDIILRQDLIDLENVRQIPVIETLIQLLRRRVGAPISFSSLARDLQVSDKTVKRWLTILENLYVIFRVAPYHRNVARALLKAPKFYFYDTGQVVGDPGARLENFVACSLLKEIQFMTDCYGEEYGLSYVRTKEGKEIDFLVTREERPHLLIEVKWAKNRPSENFGAFAKFFPGIRQIQLVKKLDRERSYPSGVEIRRAHSWLAGLSL
jgi:predicted AAA+ superfamily ATPase